MARIALFGGAFDPPHLAHLFTITWLLGLDEVDAVWLLPTADHVFGKRMTPFDQRLAWLETSLRPFDQARVHICTLEAERPGPSRTFDTLEALEARHPEHRFALVVGADNLAERDRWHRFDELVQRWPVLAVGRVGAEGALEAAVAQGWCTAGPTLPDVSSTAVRAAARDGDEPGLRWIPGILRPAVQARYADDAEVADTPPLLVLGHGRAGAALGAALRAAGWAVTTWDRRDDRAADLVSPTAELAPALAAHRVWLLAVSDEAVERVAGELATLISSDKELKSKVDSGGSAPVALHLAGRLGAEALAPLAALGVAVGSLHPLQSLLGAESAGTLRGAFCAVEGDDAARPVAARMVAAFGGRAVAVPAGGKAAWHAAAVLSANFTTVLGAGGVALLQALGIAEAEGRALLTPLLRGTVEHLSRAPAAEALTGPLARGDLAAVAAHLTALRAHTPEWLPVYSALAVAAARVRGWTEPETQALRQVLGAV